MLPKFLTSKVRTKTGQEVTYLRWWVTLLISITLSIGTWNPTGHHFIGYIINVRDILTGFKPFFILMMFALWFLAIKSIFQSLKKYGAILSVIIIMAFIWGLQQYKIINVMDLQQLGWVATISIGLLIWFGLTASVIWKKLTGVYTTDSTDEG